LNQIQTDKNCFQVGDLALLIDRKARRYMITLAEGEIYHCHLGRLSHDDMSLMCCCWTKKSKPTCGRWSPW
jgi:hypothetical protein